MGLAVGIFNDRTKTKLPNSQIDFIEVIAQPVFSNLALIFPGLEHGLNTTFSNLHKYERMIVDGRDASEFNVDFVFDR